MKAHHVHCAGCGADLPPEEGRVACPYCGKEALVRSETPRAQISVQLGSAPTGGSGAAKGLAFAIFGLAILGVVGAIVAAASLSASNEAAVAGIMPLAPGASATAAAEHRAPESRLCLLDDLSGDGVQELSILFSKVNRGPTYPGIIDGATGELRWQGEPMASSNDLRLLCAGGRWLAVMDNAQLEVRLIDSTNPTVQILRAMSDEGDRYGIDEECLSIHLQDRTQAGFSLEDGSDRECDAPADRRSHIGFTTTCGIISTLEQGATYTRGDIEFILSARRPGTPFLQVYASREGDELFDVPLRLLPVGGDAIGCFAGIPAPGVFLVFGSPRGDDHALTLLGLNESDGTERYEVTLPTAYGGHNLDLYFNGRYVIVREQGHVLALDPASGQTVWDVH